MTRTITFTFTHPDLEALYRHLKPKGWTEARLSGVFGHKQSWVTKNKNPPELGRKPGKFQVEPEGLERLVQLSELEDAPSETWAWFDRAASAGMTQKISCVEWRRVRFLQQRAAMHSKRRPYELVAEMFEDSAELDWRDQARAFLRGDQPNASVVRRASVPRADVEAVFTKLVRDGTRRLMVHAPMGDGVSTVLLQTADKLLTAGLSVFYCRAEAPPTPIDAPFVLIVDDAHEVREWPPWLSEAMAADDRNQILLGTRTYARRTVIPHMAGAYMLDLPLTREQPNRADQYIALYHAFEACEDPAGDVGALFRDGLGLADEPGSGGLWCAAYQATRGATFEERLKKYVRSLPEARRHAIALLTFANMLSVGSLFRVAPPTQAVMRWFGVTALANWHDASQEYVQEVQNEVAHLRLTLEGELLARPSGPQSPTLQLRHPRLVHVLFRWNFGGSQKREGEAFLDKYDLYEPVLRAFSKASYSPRAAYFLLLELARVQHMDRTMKRDWQKRGSEEAFGDTTLRMGALHRELFSSDAETAALVDIRESRTIFDKRREGTSPDTLRLAAEKVETVIREQAHSSDVLLDAAHFAAINRSAISTVTEPVWYHLMRSALDIPGLSNRRRLELEREFLQFFLETKSHGHIEVFHDLIERTKFPEAGVWQENRLRHFLNLASILTGGAESRGYPQASVGLGAPDETCNASIRAAYREIWRELWRMESRGALKRYLQGPPNVDRLRKAFATWADIESIAVAPPAWAPEAPRDWLRQLTQTVELDALANALPDTLRL